MPCDLLETALGVATPLFAKGVDCPMSAVAPAEEQATIFWDFPAALLLMVSITMLADFTRRLLSADPDGFGIGAIALQAALTLIATGSFTDSGWAWLKKEGSNKARRRCGLAAIVFVPVALIWWLLPDFLAGRYYAHGFALEHPSSASRPDPSDAMRYYLRAIALNPQLQPAYFNLGEVLEDFYRYDEAGEQYKKAMIADDNKYEEHNDTRDPRPYANLARILLAGGKPLTALHVAQDGLGLNSDDRDTVSALNKSKAWAEYELGFYTDAIRDATLAKTAAGDCILGKAYLKMGRAEDALAAWALFTADSKARPNTVSTIQPDCQLLAEEANAKK